LFVGGGGSHMGLDSGLEFSPVCLYFWVYTSSMPI